MRALVITQHGPPEVLKVLDRPDPEVGPGEVRIAVKAAGINFSDLLARVGMYPDAPKPPSVIGYEVAGDIESVGDGVEGVKPGDRVIAGTRFGGQAELAVTEAGNVFPLPDGWSYEKGAAVPVVYVTAYAGMIRYGNVLAGERVLDPRRGGRGRHRGDADRQAPRRRALRHRLGGEARRGPRLRDRAPDRLPQPGLRQGDPPRHEREETARPRDGRGRRQQLPQELVATARRRAPRRLRCVRGGRR